MDSSEILGVLFGFQRESEWCCYEEDKEEKIIS